MGLHISHGAFAGGYGAYHGWKNALGRAAGYLVRPVVWNPVPYEERHAHARNGATAQETVLIDWGHVPPDALYGLWEEVPADPLFILFCHADDEGRIMSDHFDALVKRLEELLPELDKQTDTTWGNERNWVARTRQFIDACKRAGAAGEDLTFR